ncbi:unnamed protein product, partial [Brachionus calyciflorus]
TRFHDLRRLKPNLCDEQDQARKKYTTKKHKQSNNDANQNGNSTSSITITKFN